MTGAARQPNRAGWSPECDRPVECDRPGSEFHVPAEAEAHGGEHAVPEVALATGAESAIERRCQDGGRHGRVDGRHARPAALAGVGHEAAEALEVAVLDHRLCRQVEEPRGDDAAAAPQLRDRGQVQVVLVELGLTQWAGLRIHGARGKAGVSMVEEVEAFRVSRHDPVLDAVVDHLDEVARAGRPAMEVALLGRGGLAAAARGARRRIQAGRQGREERVEVRDGVVRAADHQAVAALQAPGAAARAAVDVADAGRRQDRRAADVVAEPGVAAVNDDVAGREQRGEMLQRCVHRGGRHHDPHGAGRLESRHEVLQGRGARGDGALGEQSVHGGRGARVADDAMSVAPPATSHVGTHATQADESDVHADGPPCAGPTDDRRIDRQPCPAPW